MGKNERMPALARVWSFLLLSDLLFVGNCNPRALPKIKPVWHLDESPYPRNYHGFADWDAFSFPPDKGSNNRSEKIDGGTP